MVCLALLTLRKIVFKQKNEPRWNDKDNNG